jgi:hypothetical protein
LSLEIVLGGQYEFTLIGWLTKEAAPEKLQTTHDYYVSLQRRTDQSYLDRFATLSAVASELILAPVDWTDAMINHTGALKRLGVRQELEEPNEWDDDAQTLARALMLPGVLDRRWMDYISSGERHGDGSPALQGDPEFLGRHYLCRLFLQLRHASKSDFQLVLSEDDFELISAIGNALKERRLPLPFELPDLNSDTFISDSWDGALLSYSPPDMTSVQAVRADHDVQLYAARVRSILEDRSPAEWHQALVAEMREARDGAVSTGRIIRVFEIASWISKPLSYGAIALGAAPVATGIGALNDLKDVINLWLGRRHKMQSWYGIRTRMSEVSLDDYLQRNHNA